MIRDFFPFRLIQSQLKYNFFGLIYWVILFLIISESLGYAFGIPFLFFSPEYLGKISCLSFLFLGFSIGGFTMAYNVYSYTKIGPRFPFLIVVSTPFFRFCINNSLIPLVFIVFYLFKMTKFLLNEELANSSQVALYSASFILGFLIFIAFSILYFFPLRRNKDQNDDDDESSQNPVSSVAVKGDKWYNYFRSESKRPIYYFGRKFKIYKSRSIQHLDQEIIEQIYGQNRINAIIFEAITLLAFLGMGFFRNYSFFEMPAAVSIVTLLTIISMLFSALISWFHRWAYPLIVGSIIGMSYLSTVTPFFKYTSYAIGLDYQKNKRTEYTVENISKNGLDSVDLANSKLGIYQMLENWKKNQQIKKPKLIILNTSGGGSRSALWTMVVIGNCDKALQNKLSNRLQLIAGASGGMVGAAYYRELILMEKTNQISSKFNKEYQANISKDLLNKLAFSASTNDLLIRYKRMDYNKHSYTLERGAAFEAHLHQNLNNFLEHPLGYYQSFEQKGQIPLMIFSPTIINDGRRLLISSQNLSYIVSKRNGNSVFENIDYQTFFKENDPNSIRFSSVLRANATFPLVMPMITMPTKPEIQLMDAGIRDNYGGKVTIDYLFAMSDWIKKNTSGVIIVETRDTKRILNDEAYNDISLMDKITLPFGNMITNFTRTQDFDQEQLMKFCTKSFNFPVDIVTFNLRERSKDRISLSWHLTKREKRKIAKAFYSKENQVMLAKLEELLLGH
ncbi:MAG: patatin-like phospholipase family protein [Bacteroidetes bacterium]|nr:patatin-like phospholipase family protein [Bacteroidota bacterium]